MAIARARWPLPAPSVERDAARTPVLRPASGANRPPPDSLKLPFGEARQLWLALHLTEPALLDSIAARCERFTSLISLEPPDGVLLEVQGSLRLFGGLRGLVEKLIAEFGEHRSQLRMAVTPTPASAIWLARMAALNGNDSRLAVVRRREQLSLRLAAVPLVCVRWPEELNQLLDNLGITTLGQLIRLPRAGLARRLGKQWLRALDRALGLVDEPRQRFYAPQRYRDGFELDDPIETTARLEAYLAARLQELREFLRARQVAIGALSFRLLHQAHPPTPLRIALATPSADVERLVHLLGERLQRLKLPAPVMAVRMRSSPLLPDVQSSASLLQKTDVRFRTEAQALPQLLERLCARLGAQALSGIRACADRRPEKAWKSVRPLCDEPSAALPFAFAQRPVWLRSTAEALPHGAPAQWRKECGPERIESGWWDGSDVARDYYIVRNRSGVRLWVYREHSLPHQWFLQGLFG